MTEPASRSEARPRSTSARPASTSPRIAASRPSARSAALSTMIPRACSRIRRTSASASATGVGPCALVVTSISRALSASSGSPARSACDSASRYATAASTARQFVQCEVAEDRERAGEAGVVAEAPEGLARDLDVVAAPLERPRAGDRPVHRAEDSGIRRPALVPRGLELLDGGECFLESAEIEACVRERWEQREPCGVAGREDRGGALEQARRRPVVAALERGPPCARQALGRAARKPWLVSAELAPVQHRLLEVVADDLVLLDELDVLLDPEREALVQVGARLLRQRLVRGVADEEVPEAERVVARKPSQARVGSARS